MITARFNGDDESYILYLLEVHKRISSADLCKALHLSPSTMRKKLAQMEKEGLIIRTHGGAVSADADRDEIMTKKQLINIPQKRAIAAAAARFLEDGKILSFGGGSTILEMVPYLMNIRHGTILTNSTPLASQVTTRKDLEVYINSGIVRGKIGCVVGPGSELLFQTVPADRAFVGCETFCIETGANSVNILVGKVEQAILRNARERYILCDSSKLNQKSIFSVIQLSDITALITDDQAHPGYVEQLRAHGLHVILAPVPRQKESQSIFHQD